MHYYGYGPMHGLGYGILSLLGGALELVFWVIIILLIFRLIRRKGVLGDRRHIWLHSSALDILKERYAKGEINKEEFEEKKKDLA